MADLDNRDDRRDTNLNARATGAGNDDTTVGDEIGEAVGGISGVLTGAALGSLGGPIGTIIGGIAGAVSGWWAGKAISEAASHVTTEDEDYYRTHYDASPSRLADRGFDDVRPAYQIGHLAGRNPDYSSRTFDQVESDLRSGWTNDVSTRHGSWDQVRDYARHAYDRGRSGFGTGAVAGAAAGTSATSPLGTSESLNDRISNTGASVGDRVAGAVDNLHDRIDGNPASKPGPDATDRGGLGASSGVGNTLGSTADRAATGASNLGHSLADRVDDLKDRVDGNPASRPGPDATDRPSYGAHAPNTGASGLNAADRAVDHTRHTGETLGDKVENAWDKTKQGAENLGHRAADAIDNTKDRIDGNPASRPGPDSTDRV